MIGSRHDVSYRKCKLCTMQERGVYDSEGVHGANLFPRSCTRCIRVMTPLDDHVGVLGIFGSCVCVTRSEETS